MITGTEKLSPFQFQIAGSQELRNYVIDAAEETAQRSLAEIIGETVITGGSPFTVAVVGSANNAAVNYYHADPHTYVLSDSGKIVIVAGDPDVTRTDGSRTYYMWDQSGWTTTPFNKSNSTSYRVYASGVSVPTRLGQSTIGRIGYATFADVSGFRLTPDSVTIISGNQIRLVFSTALTNLGVQAWSASQTNKQDAMVWLDTDVSGVSVQTADADEAILTSANTTCFLEYHAAGQWKIELPANKLLGQDPAQISTDPSHYAVAINGMLVTLDDLDDDPNWVHIAVVSYDSGGTQTISYAGQNYTMPVGSLVNMVNAFNTAFDVEHDETTGVHTDIHADSVAVAGAITAETGLFTGASGGGTRPYLSVVSGHATDDPFTLFRVTSTTSKSVNIVPDSGGAIGSLMSLTAGGSSGRARISALSGDLEFRPSASSGFIVVANGHLRMDNGAAEHKVTVSGSGAYLRFLNLSGTMVSRFEGELYSESKFYAGGTVDSSAPFGVEPADSEPIQMRSIGVARLAFNFRGGSFAYKDGTAGTYYGLRYAYPSDDKPTRTLRIPASMLMWDPDSAAYATIISLTNGCALSPTSGSTSQTRFIGGSTDKMMAWFHDSPTTRPLKLIRVGTYGRKGASGDTIEVDWHFANVGTTGGTIVTHAPAHITSGVGNEVYTSVSGGGIDVDPSAHSISCRVRLQRASGANDMRLYDLLLEFENIAVEG